MQRSTAPRPVSRLCLTTAALLVLFARLAIQPASAQVAATMRGEMVPRDIFDLAVKERDAFRQRKPPTAR